MRAVIKAGEQAKLKKLALEPVIEELEAFIPHCHPQHLWYAQQKLAEARDPDFRPAWGGDELAAVLGLLKTLSAGAYRWDALTPAEKQAEADRTMGQLWPKGSA